MHHQEGLWVWWLAKDNPETNPTTIKPETAELVELFSWVPLPYCSPPGVPFLNKISCFVSKCVSSDNSFLIVRQEPSFGLWKGFPFLPQILKEINPVYSLEGVMLKLQYSGHLIQKADSLEKTLMLGKIEDKSKRGQQRMKWLDSIINSMDMNLSKLWEIVKDREVWHGANPWVCKESDTT